MKTNADNHPHRKPWFQIPFWVLSYIEKLRERRIMQKGIFGFRKDTFAYFAKKWGTCSLWVSGSCIPDLPIMVYFSSEKETSGNGRKIYETYI